ncbi:hypothetical protein EXN66_Car020761 [Channa argus]|uniref:Uncharacterized protein n=1 Tax=Channa argus TaxID=215402 RepID=A0A6G1QQS3_CHAAH|nr:hypothetical protein EXN66_Car020761 [Channa argus]
MVNKTVYAAFKDPESLSNWVIALWVGLKEKHSEEPLSITVRIYGLSSNKLTDPDQDMSDPSNKPLNHQSQGEKKTNKKQHQYSVASAAKQLTDLKQEAKSYSAGYKFCKWKWITSSPHNNIDFKLQFFQKPTESEAQEEIVRCDEFPEPHLYEPEYSEEKEIQQRNADRERLRDTTGDTMLPLRLIMRHQAPQTELQLRSILSSVTQDSLGKKRPCGQCVFSTYTVYACHKRYIKVHPHALYGSGHKQQHPIRWQERERAERAGMRTEKRRVEEREGVQRRRDGEMKDEITWKGKRGRLRRGEENRRAGEERGGGDEGGGKSHTAMEEGERSASRRGEERKEQNKSGLQQE